MNVFFYEIEAEKEGWSVPALERQIHSFLLHGSWKAGIKNGVLKLATEGQAVKNPADIIKEPYILDFLGLPDSNFKISAVSKLIKIGYDAGFGNDNIVGMRCVVLIDWTTG